MKLQFVPRAGLTGRTGFATFLFVLCAMCGAAAAFPAQAIQFKDDRGVTITLAQPPQRIVSMLPSLTESICEFDQCHRLVGVDRYSNYPASVKKLPVMGGGMDPNIEGIVALKPDVVVLASSSRMTARLESLGIKTVGLEPKSHADVQRVLKVLGVMLGVPEKEGADRIWRHIDSGISAAAQSLSPKARSARVYFEVSRGPYAAGEKSFIGETLTRLGVKNVVPASLGPYPKLNPEYVVRANPDVIMIGNRSMQVMVPYPGWATMRAVRDDHVCVFGPSDADVVVRPGPRMADAARIMAKCLEDKFK
ncbi:MAG: ABC transporter substrate-binding protein [Comamonadaceae bacterium]|nr:MAG: ABC transporter substrate-binding protein [Comamonadaceae bacterium]